MSAPRTCSNCGSVLPGNIADGICPFCLEPLTASEAQSTVRDGNQEAPDSSTLQPFNSSTGAERIGHYKLLQKIGEGGFGVVYLAEQEQPVKRRVALKVIKLGMDTRQVVARFEAERQALALMDHPNIAKVLDGGATEAGRPYFVMELVKGIKITQYCDQNRVGLKERLDLFLQVCHAIQHAHQKGIIHRDIKPSNILVSMHDGVPVPKVIDFGIAKATEQRLTDKTLFTAYDQFMGTPAYMSPEQAEMSVLDIDTRSDIYSLGVLLYELLTGRTPFENEALLQRGIEEARRAIREEEPPRPSTKLSTLGEGELDTVAKQRAAEAPKLLSSVRGDLDWIVMKCLEKDRTRRYETANGLAMDIKRFLNQEPIIARPPSNIYRFQKLVRRNKAAFAAAAMIVTALLLGLAGMTWSFVRERAARADAERHRQRAQVAVTRLEIDRAEMLFTDGQSAEALAYLARILRREPTNRVAAERIISALAYRNFCVPLFRLEHKEAVTTAEFSPDGNRLLTASRDGTARVWDGRTGQPLFGPFQHADEVNAAHFSPNGARLVTTSLDNTARIWDAHTGVPVTEPLRHDSGVLSADFSPDGQRLVTGSARGSMYIWNAATGARFAIDVTLTGGVDFVKFSPDGKCIALASRLGGKGCLVNATDGTQLNSFRQMDNRNLGFRDAFLSFSPDGTRAISAETVAGGLGLHVMWTSAVASNRTIGTTHTLRLSAAQFSPDGQYLATSSMDTSARVWDANTIEPVGDAIRHENWVNSIDFSPDGRQIVTASKDHTVRIWDALTREPLCEPLRHDANVLSARFSPDGQRIVAWCEGRGVWVWEVRCGGVTMSLRNPSPVRTAVFSPDSQRAATSTVTPTTGGNNAIRIWDLRRGVPLVADLGLGISHGVQFSADGRLLLGTQHRGADSLVTTVWDSSNGKIVAGPIFSTNPVRRAQFSLDGQFLITSGYGPHKLWRIPAGTLAGEFPNHSPAAEGFAQFSPNGQWVLTTDDQTARLWDWRGGQPVTEPLRHDDAVVWADITADSKRVATISRDKTARIWEVGSGKLLHTLLHAEEPYHYDSVQFSPDGRWVITAAGNAAQIWDSHSSQPATAPLKHDGRVNSVRFSPDATRVITASYDGTARIWDVATGHLLSEPLTHAERVSYAEFSPDNRWVITASHDRTARIWEVPTLSSSVPAWLADWAEAMAGQSLDARNASRSVPYEDIRRFRERLERVVADDPVGRWAKWFFAQRTAQTISPASLITLPELAERLTQESTFETLRQAVRLSPTNALAQARLALLVLTNQTTPSPRQMASSDWQSRRAVMLSPNDPEVLWARAGVCETLGRLTEALETMSNAGRLNPTNPAFWNGWGLMLERTNRIAEALQAFSRAIELSGPRKDVNDVSADVRFNRARLHRQSDRLVEAAIDNLAALNVSPRDAQLPVNVLDLSPYYNLSFDEARRGFWSRTMPINLRGRQSIDGVEFDVRGAIVVWGSGWAADPKLCPPAVGIKVGQYCQKIHFLCAASPPESDGVMVGSFVMQYADGSTEEMPLVHGENVRNGLISVDPKEVANGVFAWTGTLATGGTFRFFKSTWPNLRPDVQIKSIDFLSKMTRSAPYVIAITAEPYLERQ